MKPQLHSKDETFWLPDLASAVPPALPDVVLNAPTDTFSCSGLSFGHREKPTSCNNVLCRSTQGSNRQSVIGCPAQSIIP